MSCLIDWTTFDFKIIAAGRITAGTISANNGKRDWVPIPTQPDTNYVVLFTYAQDTSGFATACLNNDKREASRFEWFIWNFGNSTTGSLLFNYLVVRYPSS